LMLASSYVLKFCNLKTNWGIKVCTYVRAQCSMVPWYRSTLVSYAIVIYYELLFDVS
jgi:hypothetical protein